MKPADRLTYSPIVHRPPLRLPADARVAVWVVVNVEVWNIEWAAAGQLNGTIAGSIKAGDLVTVNGNPARDPADLRLRMVNIKRTDGETWGFAPGQVVN